VTEWSEPDERGVRTQVLFLRPKRRVSGERHRLAGRTADIRQIVLDESLRSLLREILKRFRSDWRWDRVLAVAGHQRVETARALLSTLLESGYIKLVERRDARGWQPVRVVPVAMRELRTLAGLQERDEDLAALAAALEYQGHMALTHKLQTHLYTGRLDVRLRRARLIPHLDRWFENGKSGTRRDFALFATGHTKGIEDADWRWLEANGVLEPAGIVEHVPLLLVGGAFAIFDAQQRRLDISMARGPVGLSAPAIHYSVKAIPPTAWIILENRTVFDKACALPSTIGLLWVPGYAPTWWLDAVGALLDRAPARAVIACDPDPAGIAIAVRVLGLWKNRNLSWRVAGMDAAALDALPSRIPLSQWDRETLTRVGELPLQLDELRQAMICSGTKGEQEGYFNEARLTSLVNGEH
jgi:hypothetical protein